LFRSVVLEGSNDQERTYVQVSAAGSGYFETMGIALERGRAIDERDRAGGQPVVVINSAMAERYWPGQDPLGQRFRFFGMEPVEVVGVAETISYNAPGEDPQPYAYLPLDQYYVTNMTLMARTQGDPESILRAAREELRRLDPGMVVNANTVNGILADAMTGQRTTASLLGVLGALALLIAGIGIYGVIAFAARTRRREIGIRMALGAAAPRIVGMLLGRGLLLSAAGLLLGTAIASVAMRPMRDLLFVSPHDPLTFGTIAVVLLLAALLSCAVPAWRAGRLSPMAVLRER
jgi:predicted permease